MLPERRPAAADGVRAAAPTRGLAAATGRAPPRRPVLAGRASPREAEGCPLAPCRPSTSAPAPAALRGPGSAWGRELPTLRLCLWPLFAWKVEEAFQGSKSHLGFEEPQGWSRQAVRRTAPLAMLLYSLTVLWFAREGHALYKPPQRPWYRHKVRPSFADMLATLRYACLRAAISASPTQKQERQNLLLLLPDTLRVVAA